MGSGGSIEEAANIASDEVPGSPDDVIGILKDGHVDDSCGAGTRWGIGAASPPRPAGKFGFKAAPIVALNPGCRTTGESSFHSDGPC